jgi:hypothetical protein
MANEQDEGSPRGGLLLLAGAALGTWALFKARRRPKEGSYLDFLAPPGTGRLAKELEANRAVQDQIVADARRSAPLPPGGGEEYPVLRGVCPYCFQSSHPFRMTAVARLYQEFVEMAVRPKAGIVYLPFQCYMCGAILTCCGRCGVQPVKMEDPLRTCKQCLARGDIPSNS